MKFTILFIFALVVGLNALEASKIFSDNMVIQRDLPSVIWGRSTKSSVHVSFANRMVEASVKNGKWKAVFPAIPPGGPYTITAQEIGGSVTTFKNVMSGEVYLCSGQSNMKWNVLRTWNPQPEIIDSDNYPDLRFYTVNSRSEPAPVDDVIGTGWKVSSRNVTGGFSAVCYFFGRALQRRLKVPVGMLASSVGGTAIERWMSVEALTRCGVSEAFDSFHYNGMIHPLRQLKIRGALWYQGEANAGRSQKYSCLLREMIADWRSKFGDFYFLNVQLAGFEKRDFRAFRWVQYQAKNISRYGIATAADLGEMQDIHPRRKKELGERLELIAANRIHGHNVEWSGPAVEKAVPQVVGNLVTLLVSFSEHADGTFDQAFDHRPTTFCTDCCNPITIASMWQVVTNTGSVLNTRIDVIGIRFMCEHLFQQGKSTHIHNMHGINSPNV